MSDDNEIRNLLARYCQLLDDNKTEAWAGLFAPDAVMEVPGHRLSSRTAIREFIEAQAVRQLPAAQRGKHMDCNTIVEVDEDGVHARAWTDFMVIGRPTTMLGRYEDVLVRGPDGWQIAERRFRGESDGVVPPP